MAVRVARTQIILRLLVNSSLEVNVEIVEHFSFLCLNELSNANPRHVVDLKQSGRSVGGRDGNENPSKEVANTMIWTEHALLAESCDNSVLPTSLALPVRGRSSE